MQQQSFATGVVFTLLSATGIALVGLLGKLGAAEFSLEALIFWRYVAAFILCTLFLWVTRKLYDILPLGSPKIHFLRAFFVLGAQYSFYYYIQKNTLMNGLVLLSLGPLFIPFIEWCVSRHPIGKSTWVGLVISFAGMLCILQPDAGILSTLSFIGLFAGFCQGCSQVVFGLSSHTERTELSTLYMFFLCMVFSLLPYLCFETSSPHAIPNNPVLASLIIALGVASVLNQLARATAYQHGTPSRLATFLYFSILLGGLLDWLVFDKAPNGLSLLGAFLVIGGGAAKIYLRTIILRKKIK
ncbi:MAG: DMT family transporter [Chlamydiales bacterium]